MSEVAQLREQLARENQLRMEAEMQAARDATRADANANEISIVAAKLEVERRHSASLFKVAGEMHDALLEREAVNDCESPGSLAAKLNNSGRLSRAETELIAAVKAIRAGDPQRIPLDKVLSAALAVGWRAGVTLSANVCIEHSNRLNAEDGDLDLVRQASELGKQISRWIEPTPETMAELQGIHEAKIARLSKS